MAGKRCASSDLNHTNWDQDEEPEEAGTFKKAPNLVLQKRVIKTAKRRNPISTSPNSDGASKNLFSGFSGFARTTPTTTAFGFLNNLSKSQENELKSNGLSSGSGNPKQSTNLMFKVPELTAPTAQKEDEYYAKLKGLNESVSNWIKKHVDENPFLNLKPIFQDYEKYFDELEKSRTDDKKPPSKALTTLKNESKKVFSPSVQKELSSFVFKPAEKGAEKSTEKSKESAPQFGKKDAAQSGVTKLETTAKFAFTVSQAKSETEQVTKEPPQFSFAVATTTNAPPTFNFGTPQKSAAGFSFGSAATPTFTFTNVSGPPPTGKTQEIQSTEDNQKQNNEGEDENEEPPKAEFTPVVEDGHVYTTRCKVFVKNNNTFGDRGAGNLFLKPVPNGEKVQLIVRADTNLGNLLCNFILSDSIPLKRIGKKDVMMVCLPTPESKPPPVATLLRVRSTEEADELLKVLEKYKK